MTTNNDGNSMSQTPEQNSEQNPAQNPGQNPEKKKRFSRRTLGYAGVGVLTAVVVSRCTGLIKTPEELEEERKKKQKAEEKERQVQKDRALAALEPNQEFVDAADKNIYHKDVPLVYTAYERNGEFVPATEEHPAQNVPYPVTQPEMHEYSLQGFLTFMGYFCAALNYFYYTGDTEPLSKVVEPEAVLPEMILNLYRKKRGWVVSEDDVCKAWVYFPRSGTDRVPMSSQNDRHILWCFLGVENESYGGYFYIPSIGERLSLYEYRSPLGRELGSNDDVRVEAEHLNGRWTLLNNDADRTPMYPADVPHTGES